MLCKSFSFVGVSAFETLPVRGPDPTFDLICTVERPASRDLLEHLEKNCIYIEVWASPTSDVGEEEVVGLCRIPFKTTLDHIQVYVYILHKRNKNVLFQAGSYGSDDVSTCISYNDSLPVVNIFNGMLSYKNKS